MNVSIIAKTAFRTLHQHIIRSVLTVIGIMIGIASIIVTFSIGTGAELAVRQQILAMGENALFIIPGNIIERGTFRPSLARRSTITTKDLRSIKAQVDDVVEISRGYSTSQKIKLAGNEATTSVYGTDTNILDINGQRTIKGLFFNEHHLKHHANVAVLGYKIARSLFKNVDPIGASIKIGGKLFTVIGTIAEVKSFWGTRDPNDRIYIPITVATKYFKPQYEPEDDLGFIAIKLNPKKPIGQAIRKIKRILRFMHKIDIGHIDDFTIFDEKSIASAATAASTTIKLFGLIAALIALIVGGIGVMNIMLVSVTERTQEIGIKLAIGATRQIIQLQFLFESTILSCLGGVLGIFLGILTQYIISNLTELPGAIEVAPLIGSFLLTVITGIFFGYYPALKASLLNPVDALHST